MKRTPLYERMKEAGGRFAEFAGYEMPIQFEKGILFEHKAVRENVGLFDVSHMGEILLKGKDAFATVNHMTSNDMTGVEIGFIRYSPVTDENCAIVDDILVYHMANDVFLLVVNAGNCDKMVAWTAAHLLGDTEMENLSPVAAEIAVQGRNAVKIMEKLFPAGDIPSHSYTFCVTELNGDLILLSRTGYTGEDGFEVYCNSDVAVKTYDAIMAAGEEYGIAVCGLGARDTLRLEAAMPLYGHEMDDTTKVNEIGLGIFVKLSHEFVGKEKLAAPRFKRIGVRLVDRGIARGGAVVYDGEKEIGIVTSGTQSPTLGYPIAMLRVNADFDGDTVFIDVRGKKLKAEKIKLPFYKRNY